uniref:F-box/WD repeat-containing protein 12-like n=1 Tax=Callithrix jacchus TaxID=9483 RepID=UPI00159E63AE|nr:F-box/WD repeat-containing protein 12-like [Callithrix jacchus]
MPQLHEGTAQASRSKGLTNIQASQSRMQGLSWRPLWPKGVGVKPRHSRSSLEDLLRPSEGSAPLSTFLPYKLCTTACWNPKKKNRITLMSHNRHGRKTEIITFDLTTERTGGQTVVQAYEISSFQLPPRLEHPTWIGASDGYLIVFPSGPDLLLFSITGFLLQQFQDHQTAISNFWVDPLYVLTTSADSVHLYMWEEGGCPPYLRSCCHLDNTWRDHISHRFISCVMCDNASIVLKATNISESSILVMYSLNM